MRKTHHLLLAAVAAAAAPAAARAAEAAGAWSPFEGNIGNFLWTLVTLLVVYWVLKKYAWGPLLGGLQSRERFIEDSLNQAVAEREQAREQLKKYEEKLATARTEVEAILDEARRDAAVLREREEARARQEASATIERAKREIDLAADTAAKRLYEQAAELATAAAGKILEREISAADHDRLVADAIDSMRRGRRGDSRTH
jgi:F-type H+-transporting ATPase subunit b